ncbi:MAG: gluconokinase, GntK/IdnK-type [Robiginitomaculum sp.]
MTVYIFMGVSGSGKTTLGQAASAALGQCFIEGDDLHSPLSIAKMTANVPLNDDDRAPWSDALLAAIAQTKTTSNAPHIFVACSALSKALRTKLRHGLHGDVVFLHLRGELHTIKRRILGRKGHFFKVPMLAGQFTALEMPRRAVDLDITLPVDQQIEIVAKIIADREAKAKG